MNFKSNHSPAVPSSTLFSINGRSSLVVVVFLVFLSASCASITGFQTGKVVGKDNAEAMFSVNASSTPDFAENNDCCDIFFFPNVEASFRYGVSHRLDMGIRANTNMNIGVDARYQFLGDQTSRVALAGGLNLGSFGIFSGLWNIQLPLYMSVHPNEKLDLYFNPRYTWQFSHTDVGNRIDYVGMNAGFLYGSSVKIGVDAGLHNFKSDYHPNRRTILTFGIGGKMMF